MAKPNSEIRDYAAQMQVRQWEIAEAIGVSEPVLTRMLRHELKTDDREKMMNAIWSIAKARIANGPKGGFYNE